MSLLHRKNKDHHMDIQSAGFDPKAATPDESHHAASRVPRRRSSGLKFFTSAASAVGSKAETTKESHREWEIGYLNGLRANRPTRPWGSRPLPEKAASSTPEPYPRASSAMSLKAAALTKHSDSAAVEQQDRCSSAMSHRRAQSNMAGGTEAVGKPDVRTPRVRQSSRDFSASTIAARPPSMIPIGTYRENGMRWMEKQEARSLREALEEMDIRDEVRIHAAAQDEASALVWEHRNPTIPKDDPFRAYKLKKPPELGAHARSQSAEWNGAHHETNNEHPPGQKNYLDHLDSKSTDNIPAFKPRQTSITIQEPDRTFHTSHRSAEDYTTSDTSQQKTHTNLPYVKLSKPSSRRRSGGPRARDVSGGLFRNPEDKIYEEPDSTRRRPEVSPASGVTDITPLTPKTRNEISSVSTTSQPTLHSQHAYAGGQQKIHRSEIHRNPPSQSRNPSYRMNERIETPDTKADAEKQQLESGKEIRSDDIKAATSMRMKDRSPKLPSPTVVSNRPGRPIVSFDQDWKPKDAEACQSSSPTRSSGVPRGLRSKPPLPQSIASAPVVPTISVSESPPINDDAFDRAPSSPQISISQPPVPTISLPDDPPVPRALPPSPTTKSQPPLRKRPLPHHFSTTPANSSRSHWSPSTRRATAQCAACALPIEGRIVSASSQRFHPGCFACHHCAEALECVAFYPEPESARNARLARIEARANGDSVPENEEKPGETALEDGDPSPRFYCHLDFHELFSPRCRSCKTPIESEVVLACGASWHVGHFFCAQCGDPFDAKTPFVEKDGYAWCVGCHAGRFSGKCKGCRKPVVDGGVEALGGEWHVDCFCCIVSVSCYTGGCMDHVYANFSF